MLTASALMAAAVAGVAAGAVCAAAECTLEGGSLRFPSAAACPPLRESAPPRLLSMAALRRSTRSALRPAIESPFSLSFSLSSATLKPAVESAPSSSPCSWSLSLSSGGETFILASAAACSSSASCASSVWASVLFVGALALSADVCVGGEGECCVSSSRPDALVA